MERDQVLEIIRSHLNELRERGVKTLVLIGPVARNEAQPGSDVDFLLELHPPLTYERFHEVREYLHHLLKYPVEVAMENPHHPLIWPHIQEEAVFIL